MIPRKDYGSPLRLYRFTDGDYLALPPRSAQLHYGARTPGLSFNMHSFANPVQRRVMAAPAAQRDRTRIDWDALPLPVQQLLRTSFLFIYCPRVTP